MNVLLRRRRWARDWMTYRIYSPPGGHQGEDALHHLLLQLWARTRRGWWSRLIAGQPWLSFEIRAAPGQVDHVWAAPRPLAAFVRQELGEAYRPTQPEAVHQEGMDVSRHFAGATLRLTKPACFSLAAFRAGFAQDLRAAFGGMQPGDAVVVQLLLAPLLDREWKPGAHAAFRRASQLKGDGSTVTSVAAGWADDLLAPLDEIVGLGKRGHATMRRDVADAVERSMVKEAPAKLKDHAFAVTARVTATAPTNARAVSLVQGVAAQFASLDDANQVVPRRIWAPALLWRRAQARWPTGPSDVWTAGELAALVAAPGPRQETEGARVMELRRPPPPGDVTIGYGVYQGRRVPVQISKQALFQHLLIQGKTGAGKGVFQLGLCVEMAKAGLGFSAFFPLRQDAERLLAAVPEERLQDVIYFEVGHPRWALPLNLLANDGSPDDQERVVEETVNLFLRLFGSGSIQSRSLMILRAVLSAAAAVGGHLGDAERVIVDETYRSRCAARIPNENTRRWLQAWTPGQDKDAPLNKLTALTWAGNIAAMVAQTDALNWADVIRQNRIVIANLNQERVGELAANLAAGGILNQMIRAVKSIPVKERASLFHVALYDEFRIVADGNEDLWQEAFTQLRQFKFGIGVAGQYPSQLPQKVWGAVSSSVGSKVILWEDKETEANACLELLGKSVTPADLAHLPSLQGYANILFAGNPEPDGRIPLTPSGPFTIYAPPFVKVLRDWEPAAEDSMVRNLRPRQAGTTQQEQRGPVVFEVE